jgi:hypothetical protein
MSYKFYLNFKSDTIGQLEIDEPIGFADTDFQLVQKDKMYGRDISFGGGENQFEFVINRTHYLEHLLYYLNKFGFEAKTDLIIEIDGIENIVGELDYATAITDDLEYFKCKVIQQSELQVLKRRKTVKVDVFSSKDVDGNAITPLVPENILLYAKPVVQNSKWEQPQTYQKTLTTTGTRYYAINPAQNLVKSEIEDSQTFFEVDPNDPSLMSLVKATTNMKNINITISGVSGVFDTDTDNGGDGYVTIDFILAYGKTYDTATKFNLFSKQLSDTDPTYNLTLPTINKTIPLLQRDEFIWCSFNFKVRQSANNPYWIGNWFGRMECHTTLNIQSIEISVESTAYNSITPSFRLIDVMKQVTKSISGLTLNAPRFDVGGQFYDNRLFNGNLLRGIIDKPFYVSLDDIEKSITEMNADYEIDANGDIFMGTESDFYTSNECAFFDNTQFSEMNKTFNPKFSINEFTYSYKNYQSQKEATEVNSSDTVHGESKWVINNKKVENKKDVGIQWTRDAFLIESNRRNSIKLTEGTATQDDDTLFILDTIETETNQTFNESSYLQHSYDGTKLILRNDGAINFVSLGIIVGSVFVISAPDQNAGDYTASSISGQELQLTRTSSGAISVSNDGARTTNYTYTIQQSVIPYTNYTNQGFTTIDNLNKGNQYSNLRYSVKRNIENYWNSYLATCNLYSENKNIQNTYYKNNGKCITTYLDKTVTEKADFIPTNPILSPFLYNELIFSSVELEDFFNLQTKIRTQRGFIRTIDNNNNVIKVYPMSIKYEPINKELTIKGEEKYESKIMTITTANPYITINSETTVLKLKYKIEDNKVYIYDRANQLLYNPVWWYNVSINNSIAPDILELESRLKLLTL